MHLGLLLVNVEPGGEDAPAFERVGEGRLVYHRSARGVDEDGLGLHLLELRGAYEMPGLLGERGVDREEVALLQQLVQFQVSGSKFPFSFFFAGAARVDYLHAEAFRAADKGIPNPAKTAH